MERQKPIEETQRYGDNAKQTLTERRNPQTNTPENSTSLPNYQPKLLNK
jgi:hypothetical protein